MFIHIIINTCILWLQCENMPRRRRNCITEMVEKFLVTDNESKSFEVNTLLIYCSMFVLFFQALIYFCMHIHLLKKKYNYKH